MSEKVWRVLEQGSDNDGAIGHGWTYSSHPHCAAAGVANLEVADELDVVANACKVGASFNQAINDAVGANRFVGEVRGEGLMAALLKQGIIGRAMPQGDILGFAPPLCLTKEEADIIVAATKKAVNSVTATL